MPVVNCLFAADPALGKVYRIRTDAWQAVDIGGGNFTSPTRLSSLGGSNPILVSDPGGSKFGRYFVNTDSWVIHSTSGHVPMDSTAFDAWPYGGGSADIFYGTSGDSLLHNTNLNGNQWDSYFGGGTEQWGNGTRNGAPADKPTSLIFGNSTGGFTTSSWTLEGQIGGSGTSYASYFINMANGPHTKNYYTTNPDGAGDRLQDAGVYEWGAGDQMIAVYNNKVIQIATLNNTSRWTKTFNEGAIASKAFFVAFHDVYIARLGTDGHLRVYELVVAVGNLTATLTQIKDITLSGQGTPFFGQNIVWASSSKLYVFDDQANPGIQEVDVAGGTATHHASIITGGTVAPLFVLSSVTFPDASDHAFGDGIRDGFAAGID